MAVPVKVSEGLLALAKQEAKSTQRSATAQIEHWATLGRAVEALVAYREVLALKRIGQALPLPAFVSRDDLTRLVEALVGDQDREEVKARIRAKGMPVYAADPQHPDQVLRVAEDGTRTPGQFEGRRFVPLRRRASPARGGGPARGK